MSRPRIRTLKPEFFADEKVNAVSRDARYLTIGLITRADDRGRQQRQEQGILGHVYPAGDVTIKQLRRWLGEVISGGILRAYEVGSGSYLWFPHFWEHQKINRPSESDIPPHDADPFGAMPIDQAMQAFRDSTSSPVHGPFTESSVETHPSRAGARSVPFRSSNDETSQGEETVDARELFEFWQERCGHPNAKLDSTRRSKLVARLREGRTVEEIRTAIDGAARAAYVNEQGIKHDDLELICRNGTKLEQFIARASAQPVKTNDKTARRLEWLGAT